MNTRLVRFWAKHIQPLKKFLVMLLLLSGVLWQSAICAAPTKGLVVWWGEDVIHQKPDHHYPGGVLENDAGFVSNIVAVAAHDSQGLALKKDGTVVAFGFNVFGENDVPIGLSNVVSIAVAGHSCWAIRRDGTVARWGNGDHDEANIVEGLRNVTAIAWGGYQTYLALKNDGTVVAWCFDSGALPSHLGKVSGSTPPFLIKFHGQVLNKVVAIASMGPTPIILRRDGTVLSFENDGSLNPVAIGGQALNKVVAIAGGNRHLLALRNNGTVVAWSGNNSSETNVPAGLSDVVSVATDDHENLALKRDGTVVAWGEKVNAQPFVPAGLSNVVAIAEGGRFSLSLTTGKAPDSVFCSQLGRLGKMSAEADLVFKGHVISTHAITNAAFPDWGKPYATEFEVISVFKGNVHASPISFLHITGQPMLWGGGEPPGNYRFEVGESYLVFAVRSDKPDWLYSPSSNSVARPDEFRQLMHGETANRTLDARPINGFSIEEAQWVELNLLLNNTNPTNQLYAIDKLDRMSLAGRGDDEWSRSDDFKRRNVLKVLLPLVTNANERVAIRVIGCFAVESNDAAARLEPFAGILIKVANGGKSASLRLTSIAALSGTHFDAVSNSLAQLLNHSDENVRAGAIGLLTSYPSDFSEQALREHATDASAKVRATVADVIGNGKIANLLPTLDKLFSDPVGLTNPIPPLMIQELQAGGRIWGSNNGDVHTSAGIALLKFDVEQIGDILKTNLSDKGFRLSFVRKLAPNGAETYFPVLADELKTHTAGSEQEAAKNGFHWPLSYWLEGNFGWAWDTMFTYVSAQARAALADPQMTPVLDALQIADDPGDAKTRSLYEFFLDKGMIGRAKELRRGIIRRTEDKNINRESFGFPEKLKAFDEMDKKHSLKPGLGL